MLKNFLLFASTILCAITQAQDNQYNITIDFNNVKNDRVKVTVQPPDMDDNRVEYVIPSVIPGSYSEKNYGRFIEDFKAYSENGDSLDFKRKGKNVYKIKNRNNSLSKLEYWVRDTWDADTGANYVFQPGGTNIEKEKNFVINHQGFYGYFEAYKKLPYKIHYKHPDGMYAATSLDVSHSEQKSTVSAEGYVTLVDNPVMISAADTASFMAGNMKVNVSIYSPTQKVSVDSIVRYLKPTGSALAEFFGNLPVKEYDFIMYFSEPGGPNSKAPSYGALEHSYGSFYFIPEIKNGPRLQSIITDITSHEFLHILTPLNIHSEEIENFDFRDPEMSRHLWLYEGVTEYFAHLIQVQSGLINEFKFMEVMSRKIEQASDYKNVSFTKMSRKILKDKYNALYQNVYYKGALIAFLLDIRIRELTQSKKDLRSVLLKLSEKYGPEKPFDDRDIIDEIVSMVDPDLEDYFDDYVQGNDPLPFKKYFDHLAWNYQANGTRDVPTFNIGKGSLGAGEEGRLVVRMDKENPLELQPNDVLLEINGSPLSIKNIDPLYDLVMISDSTATAEVKVRRNGEEKMLSAKPAMEEVSIDYFIYGQQPSGYTDKQKALRKGLLRK